MVSNWSKKTKSNPWFCDHRETTGRKMKISPLPVMSPSNKWSIRYNIRNCWSQRQQSSEGFPIHWIFPKTAVSSVPVIPSQLIRAKWHRVVRSLEKWLLPCSAAVEKQRREGKDKKANICIELAEHNAVDGCWQHVTPPEKHPWLHTLSPWNLPAHSD